MGFRSRTERFPSIIYIPGGFRGRISGDDAITIFDLARDIILVCKVPV